MKKLLIASMTAVLTAGVWAADFQQTRDSFEDWGTTSTDGYWQNATETENVSAAEYGAGEAYTYGTPAANTAAFGGPGSHYLKLETDKSKALWRKLAEGADATVTVDADNSYVFDTLVQFTATDEAPTPAVEDKFILWLKSDEATGMTSLMVTCGAFDADGMSIKKDLATNLPVPASFALDATVQPSAWARVSVKAIQLDSLGTVGFVVYVDGNMVSATDYDIGTPMMINAGAAETYFTQRALFPSLIDFSGGSTLSMVGFEGTGAIDDFQIVTAADAPEFTKGVPVVVDTFTVTFDANGVETTMPDTQTVNKGETATKPETDPTADGWTFDGWYADADGNTAFDFTAAITGNVTVYAKWTKATEPAKPVAPGETVSAATADDAIAALIAAGIKAPATVTDADAYAAKFEATATDKGNGTFSATWTVKAAAEASLKSDADAALAQTLEAVLDDKATVTIAAQPGFYYTVLSAATVDAAEYTPNGWALAGDTVELELPEKSGTQGFYKIGISAVEVK